ncbi:NAD(P)-dependent dehydrogenase (short-subunit alcohol dehydrogenase family) [Luteibacter rhizovicinus]|uniref:NAD(P)-dependent dehydrogenase (Short-subunit alcohol dehydrogenase family) n=1 Tax=Luteibacter rhizovicinus TaxID=242606 RepID=A0A4R3YYR3_9GAMM|nr:SDR family oxidoreductase [Luteibacter rhizovicinus]TCV97766.1 NAD(P)-dependent dehydrogenase (short-subunit alcohol dehydrogenase family) [Luteibacter rhizovicinus]
MTSTKGTTKTTVERQRAIQMATDRDEKSKAGSKVAKSKKPAPATDKPLNPLPAQHQKKPGNEQALDPRPQFMAPSYAGSGKLAGMTALITGGDSGIGRAVAVLFAREGADVAIVYLSEDADAEETRDYVEGEGQRCLLIRGDVREPAFCRDAVARTVKAFGKLSVLVNNAAFQEHADSIEDITEEHFDETLRTNLYGYFHMVKAASPHLGSGCSIINTGSETGLFGNDRLLDYSMTKGGIHAFTKALASNMVSRGVRVNAVAPGPVWTPLNPADKSAEQVRDFGKSSAMGRPAQPEELAPAYVFLAAPSCASYINGAVLPVMGGPTS